MADLFDGTPMSNPDESRRLVIVEGKRMSENEKMKGTFGRVGNLRMEPSDDATQFVVDDSSWPPPSHPPEGVYIHVS